MVDPFEETEQESPAPKKKKAAASDDVAKLHSKAVLSVEGPAEMAHIRAADEYAGTAGTGGLDAIDLATREEVELSVASRARGVKHRYVSHKHNLTLYINTAVTHPSGDYVYNDQGKKVFETKTVRFTNGAYFTNDDAEAELIEQEAAFGGTCLGRKENLRLVREPMFWKGTFPAEVWKSLQSERKYLTIDEELYERNIA